MTNGDPFGLQIDPARIDTPSWKAAADWCDETMGDGSKRWEYNGITAERDPWEMISEFLEHCFCHIVWFNGKFYMYAERDDLPVTGHIGAGDWLEPPAVVEEPLGNRPTEVRVRYVSEDDWSEHIVVSSFGGIPPNMVRREEITLNGCTSESMATRWADQYRLKKGKNVFTWNGYVGPVGADIFPGDVITIDLPSGLTNERVRVLDIKELVTEKYGLVLEQYRDGTVSDAIARSGPTRMVP